MSRMLVVGFGNMYRRDDGVGYAVVNALHESLYGTPFDADDDGLDRLGRDVDLVVLHQLVPDLADIVADYDLVVFVDAHVEHLPEPIREENIRPLYRPGIVTHQLHPASLLALARDLYQREPRCVLLSIRGHDFDFGVGLADETASYVPRVVDRILQLAQADNVKYNTLDNEPCTS